MQRPDILRTEDTSGDIVFVESDRTPAEIIDIEKYVVKCMMVRLVKTENVACPVAVKVEI